MAFVATDFTREGPAGTVLHCGAFCGLFVSKDPSKPFMGVAFKVRE